MYVIYEHCQVVILCANALFPIACLAAAAYSSTTIIKNHTMKKTNKYEDRGIHVRALMTQLHDWCLAERGRQMQLARMLGVSRSAVNDWIAGRAVPNLEIGLWLERFLAEERRKPTNIEEPTK